MRERELFLLSISILCLYTVHSFSSAPSVLSVLKRCALLEVFGDPHSKKRVKLKDTRYEGKIAELERDLLIVTADISVSFAKDWPGQRAQKVALLKLAFGSKLSQSDIDRLIGGITHKAYMRQRNCAESVKQSEAAPLTLNDHIRSDLMECVFGKRESEQRKKLNGTRFVDKLGLLGIELEQVTINMNVSAQDDWAEQKAYKIAFLYKAYKIAFLYKEFGPEMNPLDVRLLLRISQEAYDIMRKRAE